MRIRKGDDDDALLNADLLHLESFLFVLIYFYFIVALFMFRVFSY